MRRFRRIAGIATVMGIVMGLFPETSQVLLMSTLFGVTAAGQDNHA